MLDIVVGHLKGGPGHLAGGTPPRQCPRRGDPSSNAAYRFTLAPLATNEAIRVRNPFH